MKRKLLLMIAAFLTTASSFAYDFCVDNIYYNKTSDSTVEVVYKSSRYSPSYSGNVIIPEKMTCNGITYSVTSIGKDAFSECTGLTSIMIPNSVKWIGEFAFFYCTGLTSVTISKYVIWIGGEAFTKCSGLTSINVDKDNTNYSSDGGILFNKDKTAIMLLPGGYKGDYSIPNTVTEIGNAAFMCCDYLTSVKFPNSTTKICNCAFQNCTGLTSVTIGNSVISIGENAFCFCKNLTSITISNSVELISDYAFSGCTSLTSVTIPSSVTSIRNSAFENCTGLTSVKILNSKIGFGSSVFYGCKGLKSITIPDSIKSINYSDFSKCISLTSITIPNSVTYIGGSAFFDCTGLCDIYTYISRPDIVKLESLVFHNVNTSTCKLHVIKGTKALYQAADQWKDFFNIVEDLTDGIDNVQTANSFKCHADGENVYVTSDKALDGVEVYSLDGKMITRSLEKSNSYIIPVKEKACIIKSGKTAVKERL